MLFDPYFERLGKAPTLMDVRDRCGVNGCDVTRRRRGQEGVDNACEALGKRADDLVVDLPELRRQLVLACVATNRDDAPELYRALELAVRMSKTVPVLSTRRNPSPDSNWRALEAAILPLIEAPTFALARQHFPILVSCAMASGLSPADITNEDFQRFCQALSWIRPTTVVGMVARKIAAPWNNVRAKRAEFGLQGLSVQEAQAGWPPLSIFPESLQEDVDRYGAHLARPVDLSANLPPPGTVRVHGVVEVTARSYKWRIESCANAYVYGGGKPVEIGRIGDLLRVDAFAKLILGFKRRARGAPTHSCAADANYLILAGRTFCQLGAKAAEECAEMVRKALPRRRYDVNESREAFIESLEQPQRRELFANLPDILFAFSRFNEASEIAFLQAGLLVDMARAAPLEPGLWSELVWDRHLICGDDDGEPSRLCMAADEAGTTLDLDYRLPPRITRRLRVYRAAQGSLGAAGMPVFANRKGKARPTAVLSTMLRGCVSFVSDLRFTLTDLRFLTLYALLLKAPGNLERARQALGLASVASLEALADHLAQAKTSARRPECLSNKERS